MGWPKSTWEIHQGGLHDVQEVLRFIRGIVDVCIHGKHGICRSVRCPGTSRQENHDDKVCRKSRSGGKEQSDSSAENDDQQECAQALVTQALVAQALVPQKEQGRGEGHGETRKAVN